MNIEDIIRDFSAIGMKCFEGVYGSSGDWMLLLTPHVGCTFTLQIFKVVINEENCYKVIVKQKYDTVNKIIIGDDEMARFITFAIDIIENFRNKKYPVTDEDIDAFLQSNTAV